MKLTLYDLEYIIKKFEPRTREEFADFGLKIKPIGSGAFRRVYEIVGYNVVVKIPESHCSVDHSVIEWNAYKSIKKKKKYQKIRPFLPKIYTCSKHGIILMKKYGKTRGKHKVLKPTLNRLQNLISTLFDDDSCDIYWQNVGTTPSDKLVILDLGCFPEGL